ncbi:MAG: pitrilysin family protein [Elusimicrobia bacterium]|nr:pitrilysin family protein [Elusimicrobiota bacterium]
MKRLIFAAATIGLTMTIAKNSDAARPELANLGRIQFTAPKANRYVLDNGMVVYMVKDNTLPIVHISAFLKAGSAYDPADKAGLAQMTLTLIKDGGTAKYKAEDLDKTLEYLGATLETVAYTEESHVDMTALKKDTDKVLDIYADVLRNPVFDQGKMSITRDDMMEMVRRRNDNPSQTAAREARRMYFGAEHPYGRRQELTSLGAIAREDLIAFHAARFKPNNVILAVSGDFASEDEMMAKLKSAFGGWKRGTVPPQTIPPPAFSGGRKVYLVNRPVSQTSIAIVQRGLPRVDPENFPLTLMADIIGGGFQSRLFTEVRTKRGLAYVADSVSLNLSKEGFLYSFCGTKAETYSQALAEILKQFGLAGKDPVSAEELERSKSSAINPFVFKFSTPQKLAIERASEEFYGFPKTYLDNYVDSISGVSAAAVQKSGGLYDPNNAVIYVIGDSKKFDRPLSEFGQVTELKED